MYDGLEEQHVNCTLPAGVGTNLSAVVTVAEQRSQDPSSLTAAALEAVLFSYTNPTIQGLSWSGAPTRGGSQLTLVGTSLSAVLSQPTVIVGTLSALTIQYFFIAYRLQERRHAQQ